MFLYSIGLAVKSAFYYTFISIVLADRYFFRTFVS